MFSLAAAYAHGINRNHPFMDGNKRVAFTTAIAFLQWNGHRLEASEQDAAAATWSLSDRSIGYEEFAAWLRDNSKKTPRARKGKP